MRKWIQEAENMEKIARSSNLTDKKVATKEIFGSNLRLTDGIIHLGETKKGVPTPQNPWQAIAIAREKSVTDVSCCIGVARTGIEPVFIP